MQRGDVTVLNWYRTDRSNQGRSQSHLKVWACCDNTGAPQAFLVGSANLTVAGLYENVEVMALADASEHTYLTSTLNQLQHKAWDATQRLQELIEHGQAISERHHPQRRPSSHASASNEVGGQAHMSQRQAPSASTGCGPQALAVASLAAGRCHTTRPRRTPLPTNRVEPQPWRCCDRSKHPAPSGHYPAGQAGERERRSRCSQADLLSDRCLPANRRSHAILVEDCRDRGPVSERRGWRCRGKCLGLG